MALSTSKSTQRAVVAQARSAPKIESKQTEMPSTSTPQPSRGPAATTFSPTTPAPDFGKKLVGFAAGSVVLSSMLFGCAEDRGSPSSPSISPGQTAAPAATDDPNVFKPTGRTINAPDRGAGATCQELENGYSQTACGQVYFPAAGTELRTFIQTDPAGNPSVCTSYADGAGGTSQQCDSAG
jgi:hypothetical protein